MTTKHTNWIILIVLALIWGSSFILMKRGLEVFSSDEVASLRIFISFLFLSPLLFFHLKKIFIKHWKALLGMGIFGNFIPAFLFTKAETRISSSLTGMLNSLTPLFTLLLGILLFKSKTKWINVIGIVTGFVGAIGLIMISENQEINSNIFYSFYVVAATISYALSVNIIKKYLGEVNSITATVWAMLFIGPIAGVYLFGFTDFITDIKVHEKALESLGYVSILAVFGTAIAVILFNILVKNTTTLFASSVTYLIPIVAMMWGIFDEEKIQRLHFVYIIVILLGVYLVNKKQTISSKLKEKEV